MAFQTGTSSGPADLIAQLASLAGSNGWSVSGVTGGYMFANASKNLYFTINTTSSEINIRGATGINSGSAWNAQPGDMGASAQVNEVTGPLKGYYFFVTSQYIHVVIEVSTNIFKHFTIGELNKNSNYTGGAYVCASYHNTSTYYRNHPNYQGHSYLFDSGAYNTSSYIDQNRVRVDVDGKTNNWMRFDQNNNPAGNTIKGVSRQLGLSLVEALYICSPNDMNQRTPLVPIILAAGRPDGLFSLIGSAPDIRLVKMTNFNPGQILTIGSDEWYLFPHIQKTTTIDVPYSSIVSSGMYGYAYKKVI